MMTQKIQAVLLPGAVLPAELAYPAAVEALGPEVDARYKELEMYATDAPPEGSFLEREVAGIGAFADAAGFERFHLVGYSAGAACALAFCAEHPDRVLSLTLNEPGWIGRTGVSPEEAECHRSLARLMAMPPEERFKAFVLLQLAPGVAPPSPPEGPPPTWMPQRLAAMPVFMEMSRTSEIDHGALSRFERPVLYTLGGRSAAFYRAMAKRLSGVFQDFTLKEFPQRHHFDPPHRAEPDAFAAVILEHWKHAIAKTTTDTTV
jgi:pimeloyl-ACP methyl ester carboxylesterase